MPSQNRAIRWKSCAPAPPTLLPQVFDVFDVQSGCYDKRVRDVENVGDLAWYEASYGADFSCDDQSTYLGPDRRLRAGRRADPRPLRRARRPADGDLLAGLRRAVGEGRRAGAAALPAGAGRGHGLLGLRAERRLETTRGIFTTPRIFRNAVGDMVLAKIFGDDSVWMPEDFGRRIARHAAEEQTRRRTRTA